MKDYLTMFLLLCVSGNPCVVHFSEYADYVNLLMFTWLVVLYGRHLNRGLCKRIMLWVSLLLVIFTVQTFTLESQFQLTSINYMVKMSVAILVTAIFSERFPIIYFKTITFVAVCSLFCFSLNFVGVELPALFDLEHRGTSVFFYRQQFDISTSLRNSGMFWEPGAFAGYIIFAYLLFVNELGTLWKRYKKRCIILLIALLTTASTTGYVVGAMIAVAYFAQRIRNKLVLGMAYLVIIPMLYWVYTQADFLGEKITQEYETAMSSDALSVNQSRMGSALIDFYYIKKHPCFGNGLHQSTRYADHLKYYDYEDLQGFSNGFTGNIASLGIVFMLCFLIAIYRNKTLQRKWLTIIVFVLLMQGEYYMDYPLFLCLPFVIFFNSYIVPYEIRRCYFNGA